MSDMSIDVDLDQFSLEPGEVLMVYVDTVLTPEMRQRITEFFRQHYPNSKIRIDCKPVAVSFDATILAEYLDKVVEYSGGSPSIEDAGHEWSIKIRGPYQSRSET